MLNWLEQISTSRSAPVVLASKGGHKSVYLYALKNILKVRLWAAPGLSYPARQCSLIPQYQGIDRFVERSARDRK